MNKVITKPEDPLTKIDTVFTLLSTPVIFNTLDSSDKETSSINLALPNFSGTN